MGYSRENYRRVKQEYENKRYRAESEAAQRRREVAQKIPQLAEIDAALSQTVENIFAQTLAGKENIAQRMEQMKKENLELQAIRGDILESNGFPRDYTKIKYECEQCEDTGYLHMKLCPCMRRALTLAGYESSGLGALMQTQRFDTFSLEYYQGEERVRMKENFDLCYRYAHTFGDAEMKNMMFSGHTGTGKTHLSTAIAKVVIDRGFDVVYLSAQNMFSDFEREQFGKGDEKEEGARATERYLSCDLLILDDLGTEMSTQFTVSRLYHLVNTRLNHGQGTIVSTNLTPSELGERYTDRLLSRFMGEYLQLRFLGKDVRMERLRRS